LAGDRRAGGALGGMGAGGALGGMGAGGALGGMGAGGALGGMGAGGALGGTGAVGALEGTGPAAVLGMGTASSQPGAAGAPGRPWSRYDDARTAVIRDALRTEVSALVARTGRARLDIVDAGGGTGGFAVPLASLGHNVTVIDPSPDSLAGAERRAAEMNVSLRMVQGDVADLATVAGEASADLVLCHSVLEYVDSPADAMASIAQVLRPSGAVSVLAASSVAAVIHRALAGRFDDARRLLAGIGTGTGAGRPAGASAEARPAQPRRFTLAAVVSLIEGAGLRVGSAHGVRVFADLVPGMFADTDPGAADALLALEQAASAHPAFHDIATQFHIVGYR
jgi:S-adenosylmethionine-dependent methyltransferase